MNQDQIKALLLDIEETQLDFSVILSGKESKRVNGLYKPDTREIILHNKNFKTDNQLIYTAIHEYTHHLLNEEKIQSEGDMPAPGTYQRVHTNAFWARFHGLLEIAESKGLYMVGLENSPELAELTEKIKKDYIEKNGQLMQAFEEMRIRLKDNAEEKLRYDKESKELISNISHDLKTPITAIKGYVEGIRDGVADTPEKMDKYLGTIYNKANEMNLLINELTLYAKIDTNRIPYNFAPLSVNAYFDDCAEDLAMELDSKNVEFGYFNYVEDDQKIIADPEQLKRVINNIISNSLKYMEREHGLINLRVKDVGDFIQVELEDNGKGIAAKDLPNIFDRFYRTDASRNSSKGGSGIGLSIVKKIIEDHGGKIWATSREGTGTVMYFVIRKYQEVPNV